MNFLVCFLILLIKIDSGLLHHHQYELIRDGLFPQPPLGPSSRGFWGNNQPYGGMQPPPPYGPPNQQFGGLQQPPQGFGGFPQQPPVVFGGPNQQQFGGLPQQPQGFGAPMQQQQPPPYMSGPNQQVGLQQPPHHPQAIRRPNQQPFGGSQPVAQVYGPISQQPFGGSQPDPQTHGPISQQPFGGSQPVTQTHGPISQQPFGGSQQPVPHSPFGGSQPVPQSHPNQQPFGLQQPSPPQANQKQWFNQVPTPQSLKKLLSYGDSKDDATKQEQQPSNGLLGGLFGSHPAQPQQQQQQQSHGLLGMFGSKTPPPKTSPPLSQKPFDENVFLMGPSIQELEFGKTQNYFIVSPVSVAQLLGMLYMCGGAQQQTFVAYLLGDATDLGARMRAMFRNDYSVLVNTVLHFKISHILDKAMNTGVVSLKNIFYFSKNTPVDDRFMDNLQKFYSAEVKPPEEGSSRPLAGLESIFTFNGVWSLGLRKTSGTFQTSQTDFFEGTVSGVYVENPTFKSASVLSKNNRFWLHIIMPSNPSSNPRTFASDMLQHYEEFQQISTKPAQAINLKVPSMVFSNESRTIDLLKPLLAGTGTEAVILEKISKQVVIGEKTGLKATVKYSLKLEEKHADGAGEAAAQLHADTPFLFVVTESESKMSLIWGAVNDVNE